MIVNPLNLALQQNQIKRSSINFKGGQRLDVAKNQMRILLSQDIWAPKLGVKMPESILEKEALLELLEKRVKLDRLARLTNERFKIRTKLSEYKELAEINPNSPMIPILLNELKKYGNLDSVLKTLDKQIQLEEKKNPDAIKYFEELAKTEEEYLAKKLVRSNQLDTFWYKVRKNNLNSGNNFTTTELIEIIKSGKAEPVVKKAPTHIFSRKELESVIEKEYEQLLRENINVYATEQENKENVMNRGQESLNVRQILEKKYSNSIKRLPGFEKKLKNIYSMIEKRYAYKVDRLVNTDIYPIGIIWDQMRPLEKDIKRLTKEIVDIEDKISQESNNSLLTKQLSEKKAALVEAKNDWIKGMTYSVEYEDINRCRMIDAGKIQEYEYLTSENKTINNFKKAMTIYKDNNNTIPDEYWNEILR